MRFPTVLSKLEKELGSLERNLIKSYKSFWNKTISLDTHNIHKKNLKRLIREYEKAISKLKE